jgi:outer membrane murein-binding lipoprotein Lpp
MKKPIIASVGAALAASAMLAGCGLAETGAVATTQAEAAAEQAKQGRELEEKVKRDIAAAQQAEADARAKMEEASQ